MQILKLKQGSEEWKSVRLECITASEAPIIMGVSPYMSRDDLLKYKTTKNEKEISYYQQIIYDKGHELEASARPLAELRKFDGDDLSPITGITFIDGIKFLASYDGVIMPEQKQAWEHKQFNQKLYDLVKYGGDLEPMHYWQLEAQAMVGDIENIVFTVSDGTEEKCADTVYIPRAERRAEYLEHCKQFLKDLENYQPIIVEPKAIAELIESLPSLNIRTELTEKGIIVISNLDIYREKACELVELSKENLETDQDFANAELRIKMFEDAEKNIAVHRSKLMGEFVEVDKIDKLLASIDEMFSKARLNQKKQVDKRKDQIRLDAINNATAAFQKHVKTVNDAITAADYGFSNVYLPPITVDFAGAIKGKRTIKTLLEAANNELARAKVEANRIASIIDVNLSALKVVAVAHAFLFADIQKLCTMDTEGLKAIAINRIADHKKQEDEKIAAAAQKIADQKVIDNAAKLAAETKAAVVEAPIAKPSYGGGGGSSRNTTQMASQITGVGVTKEEQLALYPEIEVAPVNDDMAEYFGDPVIISPVATDNGQQTIIGRSQVILAVHKYWGISLAEAEQAIVTIFK